MGSGPYGPIHSTVGVPVSPPWGITVQVRVKDWPAVGITPDGVMTTWSEETGRRGEKMEWSE